MPVNIARVSQPAAQPTEQLELITHCPVPPRGPTLSLDWLSPGSPAVLQPLGPSRTCPTGVPIPSGLLALVTLRRQVPAIADVAGIHPNGKAAPLVALLFLDNCQRCPGTRLIGEIDLRASRHSRRLAPRRTMRHLAACLRVRTLAPPPVERHADSQGLAVMASRVA
jgi:hypothetical protein